MSTAAAELCYDILVIIFEALLYNTCESATNPYQPRLLSNTTTTTPIPNNFLVAYRHSPPETNNNIFLYHCLGVNKNWFFAAKRVLWKNVKLSTEGYLLNMSANSGDSNVTYCIRLTYN